MVTNLQDNRPRVLLIYNHLTWHPLYWLSFLIRVFTYGPNHAALLKDGCVHEMIGAGYKVTPLEEWLTTAKRKVLVYRPVVELHPVEVTGGYGFLDLIQFFLHIIRRKWLLIGNDWNGTDGVRLMPGMFCSEYVGLCLGRKDAHLLAPADLEKIRELEFEFEFETQKK